MLLLHFNEDLECAWPGSVLEGVQSFVLAYELRVGGPGAGEDHAVHGIAHRCEGAELQGLLDIKRQGKDVTVVAWSNMVPRSLEAAEQLSGEGIEVEVVDPRTLVPLDRDLILESVRKTGRLVIVQEAVRRGGVASDIASIVQEEAFDVLTGPVRIVAGRNTPIPYNATLEQACVPQIGNIVAAVKETRDGA